MGFLPRARGGRATHRGTASRSGFEATTRARRRRGGRPVARGAPIGNIRGGSTQGLKTRATIGDSRAGTRSRGYAPQATRRKRPGDDDATRLGGAPRERARGLGDAHRDSMRPLCRRAHSMASARRGSARRLRPSSPRRLVLSITRARFARLNRRHQCSQRFVEGSPIRNSSPPELGRLRPAPVDQALLARRGPPTDDRRASDTFSRDSPRPTTRASRALARLHGPSRVGARFRTLRARPSKCVFPRKLRR